MTDSTGSTSCGPAGSNAQANYLAITSTVTWPNMNEVKPVVIKSLIAPPNGSFGTDQGSLCVQVVCNTTGVSDRTVSLTGAGSFSDVTDSSGSVFFGYIPTGNYTVTVQDTGIDRNGGSPPSKQASVVGGTTSTITLDDCQPGAVKVKYDTKRNVDTAPKASSNKFGFSLGNSGLAAPGPDGGILAGIGTTKAGTRRRAGPAPWRLAGVVADPQSDCQAANELIDG